jgi:hypothetical protein
VVCTTAKKVYVAEAINHFKHKTPMKIYQRSHSNDFVAVEMCAKQWKRCPLTHIVSSWNLFIRSSYPLLLMRRTIGVSIENNLLIYKTILKSILTYRIPLWTTACNSNIEILQSYQNKVLRAIVNAPWYISNKVLHADLNVQTIREEIAKFNVKYRDKIKTHPRTCIHTTWKRRMKRFKPKDLTTRFS